MADKAEILTFEDLAKDIEQVHMATSSTAKSAVNQLLTLRNWIIGYYIVEFEQNGQDRAAYGTKLLGSLAKRLSVKGLDRTNLNLCRLFYSKYPQICETLSHKFNEIGITRRLPGIDVEKLEISGKAEICETASRKFVVPPEMLVSKLSFSHIREIMAIDDSFERFFYEFECMQGAWSVRELKRQIASNLYVRAGISKKPEILLEKLCNKDYEAELTIKDPFTFEFLGLSGKLAVEESDIEKALLDHLQEFLLELGKGFCLEARQKRLLIDDEYFYPDLIFYHRFLHCNVIFELKDHEFRHADLGQLNAYVAYYKKNEMAEGDNPPVGILLCTKKGPQMVEYALSGMDNQLFVSTYMLHLPDKKQLEEFLIKQMENDNGVT